MFKELQIMAQQEVPNATATWFNTGIITINPEHIIDKETWEENDFNYTQKAIESIAWCIDLYFLTEFICMEACKGGKKPSCETERGAYMCCPHNNACLMMDPDNLTRSIELNKKNEMEKIKND